MVQSRMKIRTGRFFLFIGEIPSKLSKELEDWKLILVVVLGFRFTNKLNQLHIELSES